MDMKLMVQATDVVRAHFPPCSPQWGLILGSGLGSVGMSTVPEAMLANAAGLEVLGLSCIVNKASGSGATPLSHSEVTSAADNAAPVMHKLLRAIIENISACKEDQNGDS